jgi:Zn finger protein HypA/HybF involved in hydrogenase expression
MSNFNLNCSNCNCPLIYIREIEPKDPNKIYGQPKKPPTIAISTIQAKCPHCNDKSWQIKAKNPFYIVSTDYAVYSGLEETELDDTLMVLILTEKGIKAWRP